MASVSRFRNLSACICMATVMPSSSVMRFAMTFCAVSESERSTPHSRMRLPNMRKPTSETDLGATKPAIIVTNTGNMILTIWGTSFCLYSMRILRSFLVVSSRITGG